MSKPNPNLRRCAVFVGDQPLTALYTVSGEYHAAILYGDFPQPEEWPEVEVESLWTEECEMDVSGLLADDAIRARVEDQVDEYVGENRSQRAPDDYREHRRDERHG